MIQKLLIASLAATFFACHQPKAQHKEFTQKQLHDDLAQLVYELKTHHPGLYWFQSPEDFDQQVQKVETAIINGQNFSEFYKSVNKLTSSIGCGHTRTRMPENRYKLLIDSTLVVPLPVFLTDGKIYTIKDSNGIPAGSEVVSVNDFKSDNIIQELRSVIPSDGFNTTGKDHYIAPRFGFLLALFLGFEESLTSETALVEYVPPLSRESQTREVPFESVSNKLSPNPSPLMSLTDSELPNTKILKIRIFSSGMLNRAGFDYFDFLESAFRLLREKQTQNLIIDVRGNGGGDDHYGATLVSYITDQAFGYFEKIEVTENYDGYGDVKVVNGKHHMLSHRDLAMQQPAATRFSGQVFILADGGSFSTTADFVSISKNIGAAKIVGLETGGGACGNTSGNSKSITLKNSGIKVQIQMWGYFSAINKNLPCGNGVFPDYKVVDLPYTDEDEALEVVGAMLNDNSER